MPTFSSGYVGDYAPGTVIDIKFTTLAANEAPTALAGTPVVSIYKDNSTTETTAGVTLTTSFDGRAGTNHLRIDTSADATFYASGSNFQAVITAGTVNSVSVVGIQVGLFSLNRVSSLRPTTAGRTLDVAATGEAGLDFNNVLSTGLITLHSLTVTNALTVSGGVTITNSTTNGNGLTITGNGTGDGIQATGGASAGHGFEIIGTGGGHGLFTKGSGTGGVGLYAVGSPVAGVGIWGQGGSTSGNGMLASAQSSNSHGFEMIGSGTGNGMYPRSTGSGSGLFADSASGSQIKGNIDGDLLGTLTATERTAIANSLLDQTNGIETGVTMRNALKLMVAALAGELAGGGTTTITIKAANNNATTRITATVDASGNRSAITFNL